jgi:hypothetical protein
MVPTIMVCMETVEEKAIAEVPSPVRWVDGIG